MSTPVFAYLYGTDTESEPFEDPIETETPESPFTVAPPTSLPESTPPTLVPILRRTARMVMRILTLHVTTGLPPVWHRWQLCLSPRSEDDEEIEESLDSDSVTGDEDPATGDEGPDMGVESRGLDDESHGLDNESHGFIYEGHSGRDDGLELVVETAMGEPLGLGYGALRRWEIALGEGRMHSVFEVGQSSKFVPESKRPERVSALRQPTLTTWIDQEDAHSIVPSPILSPMVPLTIPLPVASPATDKTEGFLTELGARVKMQEGLICDHTVRLEELSPALFKRYDRDIGELFTRSGAVRDEIFSQRYRFRSLEHEQERVAATFGAIWRRLAEERRAQLDLAEIIDSMRRGQEPRGDV
ncbi:hypothetical protein Tco_0802602 [Tanacetum coccineum]|uniref:Uncharacterized protein n=1 Tax=Tanacetum coccineum TaxID=301880 RepID=A0ABQ4ZZ98_9ASTR